MVQEMEIITMSVGWRRAMKEYICEDRCQWLDEGEDTLSLLIMARKKRYSSLEKKSYRESRKRNKRCPF